MHEYLDYFISQTEQPFFNEHYPKLKKKIHQNCIALRSAIESIDQNNFFDQVALINHLEAEILIIFEFSEPREWDILSMFTEEEVLKIAMHDCKTYFKEKCGLTLINATPHSLHFCVS